MISVAIDGPAGAGKSSVAKKLAKRIGFIYVDTGALYRTVGLYFLRKGINTELKCDVEEILKEITVEIKFVDDSQHVFLNGEDVSEEIRTPEASMMASAVSAVPCVRAFLLEMQRKLARENNVLMDGRDIGTVVLPNAQVKIFLTASAKVRAQRRYDELTAKGMTVDYNEVLADIEKRDYNDSHRDIAPLKPAEDSVTVDTSELNVEQVIETLKKIVEEKTK
ncbi:MAG: (d)CMP kinase [Clostridiales bacterium]|nr:(d)CMP kinase [Candidatus Equinaster intestinalis]